jgi:hypothetical protein
MDNESKEDKKSLSELTFLIVILTLNSLPIFVPYSYYVFLWFIFVVSYEISDRPRKILYLLKHLNN